MSGKKEQERKNRAKKKGLMYNDRGFVVSIDPYGVGKLKVTATKTDYNPVLKVNRR